MKSRDLRGGESVRVLVETVDAGDVAGLEGALLGLTQGGVAVHGLFTAGRVVEVCESNGVAEFVGSDIFKVHLGGLSGCGPIVVDVVIDLVPFDELLVESGA